MSTAVRPSAISGVTASGEAEIMTVYPSIGSTGAGRLLGSLYECIPLGLFGIKLSHVLFALPTAPLAALLYFLMKIGGSRYMLTNRAIQRWDSLGHQRRKQVLLTDIEGVAVRQLAGQAFFRASDLQIIGKNGDLLLTLEGIPYAPIFRQTILEARDARQQVASSLETIQARKV